MGLLLRDKFISYNFTIRPINEIKAKFSARGLTSTGAFKTGGGDIAEGDIFLDDAITRCNALLFSNEMLEGNFRKQYGNGASYIGLAAWQYKLNYYYF